MSNRPTTGFVARVTGVDSGTGIGVLSAIRYFIRWNYPEGGLSDEYGPLIPANRRPVDRPDAEIVAAKPGDIVALAWFGNEARCLIIEGLASGECED